MTTHQQLLEGILDAIPGAVFWKDCKLVYQGCNRRFAHDAGFGDPQDVVGKDDRQMPWREQAERYRAGDREVIDSGQPRLLVEEEMTTPDGRRVHLLTSRVPLRHDGDEIIGVLGTYQDITALTHASWALGERVKEQRCLYRITALAARQDLATGALLTAALQPIAEGFQHPEITGVRISQQGRRYETPDFRETPWMLATDLLVGGISEGFIEVSYTEPRESPEDGPFLKEERTLLEAVAQTLGQSIGARRARDTLIASEKKYRTLFESSRDAIMTLFPPDWHFVSANQAALGLFGVPNLTQMTQMTPWDLSPPWQPDGEVSARLARQHVEAAMRDGACAFEWTHASRDGKPFPTSVVLTRIEIAGRTGLQATVRDIGELRRQQHKLEQLNRALKTLGAGNHAVVHARSEPQLLQDMCDAIVRKGGFRLAWVGYAEHDDARHVRPMAWSGEGADYVQTAAITWADDERGQGPTGRCIRSGAPQAANNILTDPQMTPWREAALAHGYQASLALPLKTADQVFGALMIYATQPDAFDVDALALLEELAGDLAYGITTLKVRAGHAQPWPK